jgi:PKD repeat protein
VFVLGTGAASAAPGWVSTVGLSSPGVDSFSPDVAVDPAGDAVAVWARFDPSSQVDVIQAAVRPAGGSFGAPIDLTPLSESAGSPRVAIDAAGDVVVVWLDSTAGGVVQEAVRPAGGSFGAPVDLSASGQSAFNPQIAVDAAGDAVAVWQLFNGSVDVVQAAARPAGGGFSALPDVAPGENPQVAMDAHGDAVAVWVGSSGAVQEAVRPPGARSFGKPGVLSATDAFDPQVAVDQNGDAVAVWDVLSGNFDVVQAAVQPAGGAFAPATTLSATGQGAFSPTVALDQAGDAVAMWYRPNGTNDVVQAAARPAGGSFSALPDVSTNGQDAIDPHVTLDRAGDAVAVWTNTTTDVVQAAARPAGAIFGAVATLSAPGTPGDGTDLSEALAGDAAGDAVALWQRSNGTNDVIESARYDAANPQLQVLSIPASGTAGSPVPFSVSPVDVFSGVGSTTWSFGDGQSASGTSVSHAYASPGTYHVSVTASDRDGNTSTASATITISAPPPPPPPPHGTSTLIGCSPSAVTAGQATTCTATVTDDGSTGASTPTGRVTFASGTGSFGAGDSCTLSGAGQSATCAVRYTPGKSPSDTPDLTATYSGDSRHTGSSGFTTIAPVAGVSATVSVTGTVLISVPAGAHLAADGAPAPGSFVPLKGTNVTIPIGATIDARNGTIRVATAADYRGALDRRHQLQTATFAAAMFTVKQLTAQQQERITHRKRRPTGIPSTDLVLTNPSDAAAKARCHAKGPAGGGRVRSLTGSGKGLYRTIANASTTTVRNGTWTVQDLCNGSLTEVGRGSATVTYTVHRHTHTVSVKRGQAFFVKGRFPVPPTPPPPTFPKGTPAP